MASEGLNFPSEPRSFFRIREPIFSGLQLHGGQRISNNPAPSFAALMYSPVGLLEVSCLSLSLSLSLLLSCRQGGELRQERVPSRWKIAANGKNC